MRDHKLAIIIPAYKADYLEATLTSLHDQTDKQFTVYIGDDCSPYDLKSIVDQFIGKINIVYHRFDQNMGGISLTKQWERCVNLSDEEWIWLFSDDDIMERKAVEIFHSSVDDKSLLYKFNTYIIDGRGDLNPIYRRYDPLNKLEGCLSSANFIKNRLRGNGFRSFAVEYIFHRSLFSRYGFIEFPLAWNSDDATWLRYSISNGKEIKILNGSVFWRLSESNITSDTRSNTTIKQKVEASLLYIEWLSKSFISYDLRVNTNIILKWFSIQIGLFMPQISVRDFYHLLRKTPYSFQYHVVSFYYLRHVKFQLIKRNIQVILKRYK